MSEEMQNRILKETEYILQTGSTVRAVAERFAVSKSTVHKDVTERLKSLDVDLWGQTQKVLLYNLSQRHIRGGMATKRKFSHKK